MNMSSQERDECQTVAAGRRVAALHSRLEALSNALLADEEPQGAVIAVIKKVLSVLGSPPLMCCWNSVYKADLQPDRAGKHIPSAQQYKLHNRHC